MGRPFISVVVTAYNRREYLKYAVKSVINQTLDKGLYEMIVVKNFRDSEVDKLIEGNRGRIIEMGDEPIGRYLARGINESEGEVITFLDDDDVYHSRKLERLYKVFNEDENLDYYHHNLIAINKYERILNIDIDRVNTYLRIANINDRINVIKKYGFKCGSGMSAIAIRKRLAYMLAKYVMPYVIDAPDFITFAFALNYGKVLIHEPYTLTFYRVHDKNTSKGFEGDLKRVVKRGVRTLITNYQISRLMQRFVSYDVELRRRISPEIGYVDIVSSIVIDWKYYVTKYSLEGLLSGIEDASIHRIAAAMVGLIYLVSPYVAKKIIQWRYFGNKRS